MGGNPLAIIQYLRRTVAVPDLANLSDEQLLQRFVSSRDEQAFGALVRRHGPMVLGVCRRILGDPHEAEDAFQATFLVLATKAASVAPAAMLPNWLHGVARQTAVRARSAFAKRRRLEKVVPELPEPQAALSDSSSDLRSLLDEVLGTLPCKYRVAVVLCDLEGHSHKDAASRLGWPAGTLASRHSRGRKLLKERLAKRGIGLSAAVWTQDTVSAWLPLKLITATVQAGSLHGTGAISDKVTALTEGVLHTMSLKKVKTVGAVLLILSVVGLGGGLVCRHTAVAGQPDVRTNEQPRPRSVAREAKKPVAAPREQDRKDRLEVRADGKQIRVRAAFRAEELLAVADRMSYEEGRLLVLEGNVKVQKRRGKEVETIQGEKVIIDRKAGTLNVQGAFGVRRAVPTLGPVPVALDFGFPIVKEQKKFAGAGQEGRVYQVPFVDTGTLGENQGQANRPVGKPTDGDLPALKKELDELREKVKKLEKRLSDEAAAAKDFDLAEFYRRTGHPGTASFYYELVTRRHPHTSCAARAKQHLIELQKQMGP
jgi:RNA polymerase sigma-70 factor (ECF subfamily)